MLIQTAFQQDFETQTGLGGLPSSQQSLHTKYITPIFCPGSKVWLVLAFCVPVGGLVSMQGACERAQAWVYKHRLYKRQS